MIRGDYEYCRVPETRQLSPLVVGKDNSFAYADDDDDDNLFMDRSIRPLKGNFCAI